MERRARLLCGEFVDMRREMVMIVVLRQDLVCVCFFKKVFSMR